MFVFFFIKSYINPVLYSKTNTALLLYFLIFGLFPIFSAQESAHPVDEAVDAKLAHEVVALVHHGSVEGSGLTVASH